MYSPRTARSYAQETATPVYYFSDNEASLVSHYPASKTPDESVLSEPEETDASGAERRNLRPKYALHRQPQAAVPAPTDPERGSQAAQAPRSAVTDVHGSELAAELLNMAAAGAALASGVYGVRALKNPEEAYGSAIAAQASGAIWTAAAMLCQNAAYRKMKAADVIRQHCRHVQPPEQIAVSRRFMSTETSSNLLSAFAGLTSVISGVYAKNAIEDSGNARPAGVWAAVSGAAWSLQGLTQLIQYGLAKKHQWQQPPWDMPSAQTPISARDQKKLEIPEVISNTLMLAAGGASLAYGALSYQATEQPAYARPAAAMSLLSGTAWIAQSAAKKVALALKSRIERDAADSISAGSHVSRGR